MDDFTFPLKYLRYMVVSCVFDLPNIEMTSWL